MDENTNEIRRIPPHSQEAEQSVIGSMMIDPEAIAASSSILTEDDFYQKPYALLFRAIVDLDASGRPVDEVTLQDRLREMDAPEDLASSRTLSELVASVPLSTNARHYAKIVAEKAQLRRMIKTMEGLTAECYADKEKTDDLSDKMEKQVFQLLTRRQGRELTPISQIVMDALDRISAASSQNSSITGLATGFRDLDFKTSGFQPSDLILVAARPSMGKTAFVLNIGAYMAFRDHRRVAIFSLEMSKEQLVNRLLAQESNIDATRLRNGRLKDSEWENLVMGADVIGKSNLVIDDTPGISVAELRSKCRRLKLEGGLDCIMVDYLQLMSGGGRGSDSRQQEISEISRGLKEVARELHVPLIALSQLSRAVEQRPDHRPVLSDLRESGAIEQDADVVIFLYRDDYYNKDSERQGIADILIRKQRNGPLGDVELVWLPEYTKFANPANERDRAQNPGG
ncbi:MAG: replicative DNA helicase [Lachnospiraceae bacterium]|nr:replicative DNA helicase [Lachnospiraceae bacterium]